MSRILDPQLSFADLELNRLGVHLDPILQGIDAFLQQHSALIEQVRLDLERGLKNPGTGRNGITPSQTLRSLTLMRVKNWDYRATLLSLAATWSPSTTPSTGRSTDSPRPRC
jgi:hypothetical protein